MIKGSSLSLKTTNFIIKKTGCIQLIIKSDFNFYNIELETRVYFFNRRLRKHETTEPNPEEHPQVSVYWACVVIIQYRNNIYTSQPYNGQPKKQTKSYCLFFYCDC